MLAIGNVTLENRLILAPLAGYNDLPFRLMCREFGAAMCVSEMISSHGLVYRQRRTMAMLRSCAEERPVSFQLFGADPSIMGDAAAYLSALGVDCIDINMGCPVKKVTKRGAGAALMTDIKLAASIIRTVVERSSRPITVKLRSGPDSSCINVVDFARMAEDLGAAAVAVHGRTWKQGFSGKADWSVVRLVKQALAIPVIGNGDVTSHAEAVYRLDQSAADAVMIGRAAIGNPWVFRPAGRPPHIAEVHGAMQRHFSLYTRHTEMPPRSLAPLRNHLAKYLKGYPGCSAMRRRLYECTTYDELHELIFS